MHSRLYVSIAVESRLHKDWQTSYTMVSHSVDPNLFVELGELWESEPNWMKIREKREKERKEAELLPSYQNGSKPLSYAVIANLSSFDRFDSSFLRPITERTVKIEKWTFLCPHRNESSLENSVTTTLMLMLHESWTNWHYIGKGLKKILDPFYRYLTAHGVIDFTKFSK